MVAESVVLRAARPDYDEGLAFARYLDEAAEGFFRLLLGRRSDHIVATAFAEPDHDLSHRNAMFAVRGDTIVGMASGYTAEQHRRSSFAPLNRAAGRRNLRQKAVTVLFTPAMRIIDTVDDEDFYLLTVAVDEAHRGRGIGSMLMDHFEERARAAGSKRLALDVSAGNATARRLYERRGMTIASRWPKYLALPALTFYRMTKPL